MWKHDVIHKNGVSPEEARASNTCSKFGKIWMCGFWDTQADRWINRHTDRHAQYLASLPYWSEVKTTAFHHIFSTLGLLWLYICLILLQRQCNAPCSLLPILWFLDDVIFSCNGENGPESKTAFTCRPVRQVAAPGAKFAVVYYCILFRWYCFESAYRPNF